MNLCTKFGLNQIKTEEATVNQSERDAISVFYFFRFLSLRGCEKIKKKKKKKMKTFMIMARTKFGFGSASIDASDTGIERNWVCESYIY